MRQQCFLSFKNQKKQLLNFYEILLASSKMETEKVIDLLNDSNNKESKFAAKNGMLQTVKQQKENTTKRILKNF